MINTTYVVIAVNDITDDMIAEAVNTPTSFRKALDRTTAILKYNTRFPNSMNSQTKYTHAGILAYLVTNTVSWNTTP